jgi:hypothetical protein
VTGNGLRGRLAGAISATDNSPESPAQALAAARRQLDAVTDQLAAVADWKARLRQDIARAQLVFELVDIDTDTAGLEAEVALFTRVCTCLAWRGRS